MERAAFIGRVATELSLGQAYQQLENFDFGDSGAFAEIHVPQFPGGMGREVLSRSRAQRTSAIDSMRTVSRHHNVTGGGTTVAEVVEGGGRSSLWGAGATLGSATLAITAAASGASTPAAEGSSSTQVAVVSSCSGGHSKLPPNATPIASVLHRVREQHLNATRKIEETHGGTEARAPPPSSSTALVLPTGVILPPAEMTPQEEAQVRKENGGLLVVHTAQSALQTKHFNAEELAKPTIEETEANIDRTKSALQAKLEALQDPTGVGSFKVKKEIIPTTTALVLHGGVDGEKVKVVVDNAMDPFAPTNRKALKLDRSELVTTEDADPAPIIRSPTGPRKTHGGFAEAMAAAEKKLVSIPAVVNNYRNTNGQIFTLEERQKAEGNGPKVNVLSQTHKDVVLGLRRAQQEHEIAAAERDKARLEEEEKKKLEQDQQATEMAKQVIANRAAAAAGRAAGGGDSGGGGRSAYVSRPLASGGPGGAIGFGAEEEGGTMQAPTTQPSDSQHGGQRRETREERLERVKHERENRTRERDAKHRVSKLEATARRLGISLEALENDHDLMSKIDNRDAASSNTANLQDEIFDARIGEKLGREEVVSTSRTAFIRTSGGVGLTGGVVGASAVNQELKRMQQEGVRPQQIDKTVSSDDEDDDDDPLKLKSLGQKRARDE